MISAHEQAILDKINNKCMINYGYNPEFKEGTVISVTNADCDEIDYNGKAKGGITTKYYIFGIYEKELCILECSEDGTVDQKNIEYSDAIKDFTNKDIDNFFFDSDCWWHVITQPKVI